jgi:hypothetical protein
MLFFTDDNCNIDITNKAASIPRVITGIKSDRAI